MTPPEIDLPLLRRLAHAAVMSDCCDQVGRRDRTLLPGLSPQTSTAIVIVGFARPVMASAVSEAPAEPYANEVAYIDALEPDDVVVARTDPVCAFWGELFSTAAMARGAVGAVIDGYVRDTAKIAELGWPVLARGTMPTDSLGRLSIQQMDEPIELLGVSVRRHDLVVADGDGVVIVPAEVAQDVAMRAIEKASTESSARAMLSAGAYLRDAWERYRVL